MNLNCAGHLIHLMPNVKWHGQADLREILRRAKKSLLPVKDQFDAIAVRGVSGLLAGPILALRLNKKLIIVRKEDEPRHSYNIVEGDKDVKKYVIVDDFIDSGATVIDIVEKIYKWSQAECIGVLETYNLLDDEILPLITVKSRFDLISLNKELTYGNESET